MEGTGNVKITDRVTRPFCAEPERIFPNFNDLPRCKNICGWVSLHKHLTNSYS